MPVKKKLMSETVPVFVGFVRVPQLLRVRVKAGVVELAKLVLKVTVFALTERFLLI